LACSSGPPSDSLEISSEALTVDPSATYTIAGVTSGRCVQIAGQSLANSANAQLATCLNSPNQQFRFALVSGRHFDIVNMASGKCLDVQAKSTANCAAVI
jgi:endo-1,4-beta-xylanase